MFEKRTFEQTLVVENSDSAATLNVIFEPWADEMDLPTESSLRLVAQSHLEGAFHVVCQPGRLVVMAWGGCTMRIFDGATGEEFRRVSAEIPSP
jgi:hypothetical protein